MIDIPKSYTYTDKLKEAIYASDWGKCGFDIYNSLINTPKSNHPRTESMLIMHCGKFIEEGFVTKMRASGEFMTIEQCEAAGMPVKGDQVRVDSTDWGFPLHGYVDAFDKDANPVEIKSFYGPFRAQELNANCPDPKYVMQLAVYMAHFRKNTGTLVHIDRGTGQYYIHEARWRPNKIVTCGNTVVDMGKEAERLLNVWNASVAMSGWEPDYYYKHPLTTDFLATCSERNIQKAIKGEKIMGGHPYAAQYSDYKDLWIAIEAKNRGCSVEELMSYTHSEKMMMQQYIGKRINPATGRWIKL